MLMLRLSLPSTKEESYVLTDVCLSVHYINQKVMDSNEIFGGVGSAPQKKQLIRFWRRYGWIAIQIREFFIGHTQHIVPYKSVLFARWQHQSWRKCVISKPV